MLSHSFIWKQALLRSEEHTSELQSQSNLVCRLLLEKKNKLNLQRHYIITCTVNVPINRYRRGIHDLKISRDNPPIDGKTKYQNSCHHYPFCYTSAA